MKIRVYPEFRNVEAATVENQAVVMIDTLRASSTIVAALAVGARLEPVASVAAARRRAAALGARAVLAGERKGIRVAGFALGNSPVEIESLAPRGKTIVLTTSNGTRAIERASRARSIFAAALTNASAVGGSLARGDTDVAMLCAGRSSGVAIEDLVGAGAVIEALAAHREGVAFTDGARVARELFLAHRRRLHALLEESDSGRYLLTLGAADDVAACAAHDAHRIVPRLRAGSFYDAAAAG